ncbi:hypothetical protein [Kitasatospora sp. NPDC101183]|uniref:hypothetical protein n=1 Tax=Kitasatospora sp. NPDC101183 TaxID=3364100 RepID=UPI003824A5B5
MDHSSRAALALALAGDVPASSTTTDVPAFPDRLFLQDSQHRRRPTARSGTPYDSSHLRVPTS